MTTDNLTLDDFEKELPRAVDIRTLIAALLDEQTVFPAAYLPHFSDLAPDDVRSLHEVWVRVPLERRQNLMDDLQTLASNDYLLSFEAIGRLAVQDEDPVVRFGGIQAMTASECLTPDLANLYLDLTENDPDDNVRAAAVSAVGAFVYAGEIGKLSPALLNGIEERLLNAFHIQSDETVRRCALESLGFSSRPEVPALIRSAADTPDEDWQASALFAMARSADESWAAHVLSMLESPRARLRLEAVRAAGELELKAARRLLISLCEEEPDDDVRAAVWWSLSQIGGRGVRQALERHLEACDDDEKMAFLEDALDNLTFTDGEQTFDLLDISPPDAFPGGFDDDGETL